MTGRSEKCSSCGKAPARHAAVDLSGDEGKAVPAALCSACVERLIKGEEDSP